MDTIRGIETFLPLTDGSAHECTTDTGAEVIKVENQFCDLLSFPSILKTIRAKSCNGMGT